MEVQTFEIEEQVGGTTPEIEAEAVDLIEKLGLDGQRELINPDKPEPDRFQYPEMTAIEKVVYEAIFPSHTKIKDYSAGIIPVRVLQVASHAGEYCDFIQVWHKKVRDPDPLLVGCLGTNEYDVKKRFLLARWGDALKDFKELVEEARGILTVKFKAMAQENISRNEGVIKSIDSFVTQALGGEHVYIH